MVAIYARQSIYKEDSLSIEGQIEQCKKRLNDTEPYAIYQDPGYSGKDTKRPDYERMVGDIEKGIISKIIVYKLDRITRSILDFGDMMKMFEKYKITFSSVTESFDTGTDIGKAMLYIIAIFAEMERKNIVRRVTDNYYQRAKQGFYLSGPAPYGFKKVDTIHLGKKTGTFIPNEEQMKIVVELFNQYANDETTSLNKLSRWLNENKFWTTMGKPWTSSAISKVLANPVYVKANADIYTYLHDIKGAKMNNDVSDFKGTNGCYVYAPQTPKGQGKKAKFTDLSKSFVTIALHEGIIDPYTWLKCQDRLDKNKPLKRSGKGSHSWLSGLMKCGYCGYAIMAVRHNPTEKTYINCGGRKRNICQGRKRTIQIFEIEEIVEPLLMERLRQIKEIESTEIKQDSRKVNEAKIELVKIDQRIGMLTERLIEMSGASIKVIDQAINKECEKREKLVHELEKAMEEQRQQDYSRIDFDDCINNWSSYDIEKKKSIARIFIANVIITDDEIVPTFK